MSKVLRVILGDQLSHSISSLEGCDKATDLIVMCEVKAEAVYVKHHKKKIAFLFAAMRHFAEELAQAGYSVNYTKLDDPANQHSFFAEVARCVATYQPSHIVVTQPGEYRVLNDMQTWQARLGVPVDIREDSRFLATADEFSRWAKGRKQLRMEYFYRDMRKKYQVLMKEGQPEGGQWNYDSQNRKPPASGLKIPATYHLPPDTITSAVIELVAEHFADHFGELDGFHFAVTRKHALQALQQFIEQRLAQFGDYQDAMLADEPWMYHAHIGLYLNCGLLLPLECIRAVEQAYKDAQVPLNAAEGFIRQILGWREYVRGIYWLKMPGYVEMNFFEAHRPLPDFYWTAKTKMNCLKHCVQDTKQHAYVHHIQRLMVLGNFALLAGIDPAQVQAWFLIVYADAYEWVELPNVAGMALFSDGGCLASKPYAASGAYINKMSDYCKNCHYSVQQKTSAQACPFNYLYWDFLARNRTKLANNHRLAMIYRTYDRLADEKRQAISKDSQRFLQALC